MWVFAQKKAKKKKCKPRIDPKGIWEKPPAHFPVGGW